MGYADWRRGRGRLPRRRLSIAWGRMRLQAALSGPISGCDRKPQASVVASVKGRVGVRYEMAVRRYGAVLVLGLAACGPSVATRETGQVQPLDSVAVGYGVQAAANVTGSVSSIEPGRNQTSSQSMVDYLPGHVAGLQVVRLPNGGVQLVVRGQSAFVQGTNSALLVVDGTPIPDDGVAGQLNILRPEDVLRIDVLKDGTAAIYGSRGANGVILITTRRGR